MYLIFSLLLSISLLFGYYGKIEPFQEYIIKADISGKVVEVNKSCEAKKCKNIIIKIDDYQDKIDLKNLTTQLQNYKVSLF